MPDEKTLVGDHHRATVPGQRATASRGLRVAQAPPPTTAGRTIDPVDVTITWAGTFGSDLSATVSLSGKQAASDRAWTPITSTTVSSGHVATFFGVPRYRFYQATVTPADLRPDAPQSGRFNETTFVSTA